MPQPASSEPELHPLLPDKRRELLVRAPHLLERGGKVGKDLLERRGERFALGEDGRARRKLARAQLVEVGRVEHLVAVRGGQAERGRQDCSLDDLSSASLGKSAAKRRQETTHRIHSST